MHFIFARKKIIPSQLVIEFLTYLAQYSKFLLSFIILKTEIEEIAVLVLRNKFTSKLLTNLNLNKKRRYFRKYPENVLNISAAFNPAEFTILLNSAFSSAVIT